MTLPRASPQPARRLRRTLAEQRANGKEFNTAWPAAVAGATAGLDHDERLAWARAFDATRQEWEACWHRQGPALRPCHPGRLNGGNHRFAGIRLRLIEPWSWNPTPTPFSRRA